MNEQESISPRQRQRTLILSTIAFAFCYAVWTLFSIIGVRIKEELALSETEFGLLLGMPVLTGSLTRLFFGIWADQYGARIVYCLVMLTAAVSTWLLTQVQSYEMFLIAGLGLGVAGGSFSVGIAYICRWYPLQQEGCPLGLFALGNFGAAVTALGAPVVLVAFGWEVVAQVWAIAITLMAVVFWFAAEDDPALKIRHQTRQKPFAFAHYLQPLGRLQIWRFSLYYFFVFGGFLALVLWLPGYYIDIYHVDIKTAGLLTALYAISVSVFRVVGEHLSDQYGARKIMYWTFAVSLVCTLVLSYPPTDYIVHGSRGDIYFNLSTSLVPFTLVILVLGMFMGFGMAAVQKHVPAYYPKHVAVVGGVVGMVGGLGGFFLPIAFGAMNDIFGVSTTAFMLLFVLNAIALTWMHFAIRRVEIRIAPELVTVSQDLPELVESDLVLREWDPEDAAFWKTKGRAIAQRNLWISIPALFLAFAVWMVWSVVVINLPKIGFTYSTDRLFWLAALPGLSGATLRIFYSFMVPIFGGRRWTTFSTASLLLPALGIGFAVQDPETPYVIMLILALLCGFGGGNFASSMANISFFYPQAQKGVALGLNAGLGNVGVSGVQFIVPLAITAGVFGALGGEPQIIAQDQVREYLWIQNAGFIWVPFIVITAIVAWYGMNDIASSRASFKDQSVIFKRKHNWLMCWLYTGTFGSFIGYSAGLPLLIKALFTDVDPTRYAFLGPLVGALARPVGGWLADRLGGARVTFWNFVIMVGAVLGVLYFLPGADKSDHFGGFLAMFIVLFTATGIGNGSTFRMIPIIFMTEHERAMAAAVQPDIAQAKRDATKESAAVLGFSSAVAAYGAFFVPKSYGTSISLTGSVDAALYLFIIFYLSCILITWWFYYRKHAEVSC